MGPQELLPAGAGLVIEQVQLCDELVHLVVRPSMAGAGCPICAAWTKPFHSSYERRIADLPIADRQVVVHLKVRRAAAVHGDCARSWSSSDWLAEDEPGVDCADARRSQSAVQRLRLVRALPEPPIESPRELGVDEFAFRRGRRYGTILVDAASHRVIDLLEDPSADALVNWLSDHPGVNVICRDRDGVYASAATRGAPGAMQVADRWHIVHNLADALERMAVRVLARLYKQRAPQESADQKAPAPTITVVPSRIQQRNERRHAEIHALRSKGMNLTAIVDRLRLNRTVLDAVRV